MTKTNGDMALAAINAQKLEQLREADPSGYDAYAARMYDIYPHDLDAAKRFDLAMAGAGVRWI